MPNNREEELLARVGPGTPSGEVFRRYWLPVEVSANLGGGPGPAFSGSSNPLRLTVLGEQLVLFRDGSGKPGLVAEHCSHRGTSLYYGRVEDEGLRCLYHGWLYDREGRCLDTPAEPPESSFKHTVRHPAYPCREVGGLIFAYMGPPEKEPPFPRFPQLFREDGVRITGNGRRIQKSNVFLQTLDNVLDVWHREVAHGWFKAVPRVGSIHHGTNGQEPTPIKFERTPWGACYVTLQNTAKEGVYEYHETHAVMPCQRMGQPGGSSINWAVPIDDATTRWFGVSFHPFDEHGEIPPSVQQRMFSQTPSDAGGPFYDGWVEDVGHWWNHGHPLRQGPIWEDEVIMGTQGSEARNRLPDWDRWRLATSDRGLTLMHDLWREQVSRVEEGLDPIGIVRGEAAERYIPVPGEIRHVSWDEGMRLFKMSLEERVQRREAQIARGQRQPANG
ncbi:MAG TPA: Rieske 2Fe-2S domain-containing protein [Chloroflexota bacterium]|nr:Rieske 2Fe-2S domain-containing protein [Chloroflexota bacterium]